jgi:tetratricopeptide (TPR) repeat protein
VQGDWDVTIYRGAVKSNDYDACNALLPDMIGSYRTWLGLPQTETVLALLPKEMATPAGFNTWIKDWMQQPLPAKVQLLLLDHHQQNYWGRTFETYKNESCSLHHDLRMQQAVQEIAIAGAATDPHAYFRKCMFEMGDAAGKKDVQRLQEWGQKAVEAAKKSGDKNLLATAYITYAGMLFNFKKHEKINGLLDEGLQLCHREITAGNEGMKPLLLQYYAYKGAHCQLKKEYDEALYWFMKMGEESVQSGLYTQAISSYYKVFVFAETPCMQLCN